ncbi:MAG: winged helix-turn-helix transcriptional regulator [Kiritimatiellae bacterium]|nr:winged helix-turn-helix transcriptional regulator [Kiritimatiellia bacterium]
MTNGRSLTALFKDGDIPGQSCPRNVVNYIIIRAQIKEVGAYLCHTYPILLQRAIPQATAKMLIQQLREMKGDELVSRKVYPVVPPKTEYSLTDLGKSLVPIVKAMDKWGAAWFTRMGLPVPCDKET